jgi:hypothetical protein
MLALPAAAKEPTSAATVKVNPREDLVGVTRDRMHADDRQRAQTPRLELTEQPAHPRTA